MDDHTEVAAAPGVSGPGDAAQAAGQVARNAHAGERADGRRQQQEGEAGRLDAVQEGAQEVADRGQALLSLAVSGTLRLSGPGRIVASAPAVCPAVSRTGTTRIAPPPGRPSGTSVRPAPASTLTMLFWDGLGVQAEIAGTPRYAIAHRRFRRAVQVQDAADLRPPGPVQHDHLGIARSPLAGNGVEERDQDRVPQPRAGGCCRYGAISSGASWVSSS